MVRYRERERERERKRERERNDRKNRRGVKLLEKEPLEK